MPRAPAVQTDAQDQSELSLSMCQTLNSNGRFHPPTSPRGSDSDALWGIYTISTNTKCENELSIAVMFQRVIAERVTEPKVIIQR